MDAGRETWRLPGAAGGGHSRAGGWPQETGRGGGFASPARWRTDYCLLGVTKPADEVEGGFPEARPRPVQPR